MPKALMLATAWLMIWNLSSGQPVTYSLLMGAQDLPDKRVTGIVQDPRGFIWISTFNGLFRYDGVRYKEFRSSPRAVRKISFSKIMRMHVVFGHYLILEGTRQLDILDIETERLVYSSPKEMVFVQALIQGEHYYLHFEDAALETTLMHFTSEGKLERISPFVPAGLRIDKACLDNRGALYFFDRAGMLWHHSLNPGTLLCIDSTTFLGRRNLYLPALACDAQGRLLVFDNATDQYSGAFILNSRGKFEKVRELTSHITLIRQREPGYFWHFNQMSKDLSFIDFNTNTKYKLLRLPDYVSNIRTVFLDKSGNLWIDLTASAEGILLAHPHLTAFHKLLALPAKQTSLGTACRGIAELEDGSILIGSAPGIFEFNRESGTIEQLALRTIDTTFAVDNIWKIIPDESGQRVWFTKEEGGIFEYLPGHQQIRNFTQSGINNRSLGMTMDNSGYLWIGTHSGITWFDTRTKRFDHLSDVSATFYEISSYNWVQTDENTFWLCSSNGLYRFDSTRQPIARYAIDTDPYLNTNEVFDIIRDQDRYWIATDNGLHRLSDEVISIYTVADGLAHNAIASVDLDNNGNLWVATFGGLSKFDLNGGTFQNFYIEDGLPHNEFNRLGKLKTKEGQLFFSTQNGVVYFDPAEVIKQEPGYPLVLTEFSKFGLDGKLERTAALDLHHLESVTIPAGNKYFQAEFALLNFVNAADNRYTYYMQGLEDTWRPLTTLPIVQYNNLPAGSYVLHVRAQSPSGLWSQNTLDIRVEVLEHFYQTNMFRIAMILLIAGLGYIVLRYRMMQRLHMERMRNRISSDLHDEVGGVLSGVAMQMDLLESRAPDHLKPFMQRVAESSRSAASKMRDVIWSIDSTKEFVQDLLERMKAYAIELLDPLDIKYRFEIVGMAPNQALGMYLRQNLYLIYKEALNNVIKHSQATDVHIRLEATKKHLILQVLDNGIGIPDDIKPKGYGLRNMHKRAEGIGGQLHIARQPGGGTRVELSVLRSALGVQRK